MKQSKPSRKSIKDIRKEYSAPPFDRAQLLDCPFKQFAAWFDDAVRAEVDQVNAMTLATATGRGEVSARTVLLKDFDEKGFVFFTDYRSRKAQALEDNPRAVLVFFWAKLERQVIVRGTVSKTTEQVSQEYFEARPREAQIAACSSEQSAPIPSRNQLDSEFRRISEMHENNPVPRPLHWGGYSLKPDQIEFWQGRPNRLNDRFLYQRDEQKGWQVTRLQP